MFQQEDNIKIIDNDKRAGQTQEEAMRELVKKKQFEQQVKLMTD